MKAQTGTILLFALVLTGCGGEDGSDITSFSGGAAGMAGSGGSSNCTTGETQSCVGPGACQGGQQCLSDGSWSTCNCGTGGTAGTPSAGGGGGTTGGTGGTGGTTGGTGGMPSGGTGGTAPSGGGGTGGACVPKTCATYSFEKTGKTDLACGVIQDGCGNVVDCGGCKDPMHACGAKPIPTEEYPGITNICAGKCIGDYNTLCLNAYRLTCTVNNKDTIPSAKDWKNCTWKDMVGWCCDASGI